MQTKTKKLTIMAAFSAMAFIVMVLIKVPIVPSLPFLKYEPKDVIITIGGFIFGPMASFLISLVVSFIEMMTVSDTGYIGLIMNILATCSFSCTAAYIYKKKHTIQGAILGLTAGAVFMIVVMLLWNYLITPIYMKIPRDAVAKLLLPSILPFNVLKSGLNATLTIFLYKPVITALRRAKLISTTNEGGSVSRGKLNMGVMIIAGVILLTCIIFVLVLRDVI